MSHLPKPITNYIHQLIIEDRSPAYFLVQNGCLSSWGGKLSLYGFDRLQQGESVAISLFNRITSLSEFTDRLTLHHNGDGSRRRCPHFYYR